MIEVGIQMNHFLAYEVGDFGGSASNDANPYPQGGFDSYPTRHFSRIFGGASRSASFR